VPPSNLFQCLDDLGAEPVAQMAGWIANDDGVGFNITSNDCSTADDSAIADPEVAHKDRAMTDPGIMADRRDPGFL